MELVFEYAKHRREFGKQPLFCEQGPDVCDSFQTNRLEFKNYILRNPVHQLSQNTKDYSANEANTIRAEYHNSGCNHTEGGWPKDINIHDPEATQRYRRKIEKDDAYVHCVMQIAHKMEHYILQNNAIDMYQNYYSELPHLPPLEKHEIRTINVLREPEPTKRPITSICWQCEGGNRIAVAHADIDLYRNSRSISDAFIWDIEYPNAPEMSLQPEVPLLDLQYSPREPHSLVGALLDGTVCCFDLRKGVTPTCVSPAHEAHRDSTRRVLYINTKTGTEFFSGSADGCCKWWDCRDLSAPTEIMIIDPVKGIGEEQNLTKALPVCVLEYESTIPTRFMVGTENGMIIGGNRKGKTPLEQLPIKYEAHTGPVYSLERNPAFLKNFITVGDWCVKIWSEDCRESPILWTHNQRVKINDVSWNPVRFSSFLACQRDGQIACWDLLRKQHAPVISAKISDNPLTKLSIHELGRMVACGSNDGTVYMVELSQSMGNADKNDKHLLTHIFERESKRERILEARLREIRLRLKTDAEKTSAEHSQLDMTAGDRDLQEAATDYLDTVQGILQKK